MKTNKKITPEEFLGKESNNRFTQYSWIEVITVMKEYAEYYHEEMSKQPCPNGKEYCLKEHSKEELEKAEDDFERFKEENKELLKRPAPRLGLYEIEDKSFKEEL